MKKKSEIKYEFRIQGLYKNISAEEVGKELERIRDKYGALEPENIVEESEDEESVLHNIFCWDDTKAAQLWRKKQAADLIRNIQVTIINKKVEAVVRAFVNVRTDADLGRSYVPIKEAIHNETAYQDLLKQSKNDMDSFITKYSQIEELNAVKAEMLKAITLIKE